MPCETPITIRNPNKYVFWKRSYKIPCGKCPSCLRRKRAEWSLRIYHEFLDSESSWFITLTYDDFHLPDSGVNKPDVQNFFKRLRKNEKVRYFLVSEYGDTHHRPHYHACLFFKRKVDLTECVNLVDKSWQNGNVYVGECNLATINYCSKYSLKPRYDVDDSPYGNKTFALSSRNPGIGAGFRSNRKQMFYHKEDLDFTDNIEGLTYNLPRYYRDAWFTTKEKQQHIKQIQEKYGKEPDFKKCWQSASDYYGRKHSEAKSYKH